MKLGNTEVDIVEVPMDKHSLTRLYDTLNAIADRADKKKSPFFYTKEQVQELKKDTTNIFL